MSRRPQVMMDAIEAAAAQYRSKQLYLTHNQKVARLYRNSLKMLSSWTIDREVWNDEATKIRARFDENRGLSMAKAAIKLEEGENELYVDYQHPDPYCFPYMPGGSLFMRNPPIPLDVCFPEHGDEEMPADAPTYTLNPDMTICTPETGKSAVGQVVVDFVTKKMY